MRPLGPVGLADAAAFAALGFMAAVLPFEAGTPLLVLGPVGITTTELALYAALALWAAHRILVGHSTWTPGHAPVLGWAAAVLLSACLAGHERGAALKFALRSLSGAALFFAVADLVSSARRAQRLVLALAAGVVGSALTALGEVWVPPVAGLLLAFKATTFQAEGVVRASGSLPYPTIAAMYFEAALPLILLTRSGRPSPGWAVARAAAVLLTLEAIVLTGSRAGLAVAFGTLLALCAIDARGKVGVRSQAALAVAGLLALAVADLALRPGSAARLGARSDGVWYRAEVHPGVQSLAMGTDETTMLSVRLRNRGALDWAATGDAAVFLSYEWQDGEGGTALEGPQLPLGRDVRRGEETTIAVPLRAPQAAGSYRLRWQLGRDGLTWSGAVDAGGEVLAQVRSGEARGAAPPSAPVRRPLQKQLTRLELWRTGLRLWSERPLVGVGPDNFRRLYGRALGPRPLDDRVRANSLYVETLADLGLLGAIALAGAVVGLCRAARRRWRASQDPSARCLLVGAAAGLAAFLAHGLVDEFLAFVPTLGLFWLLAGIVASPAAEGDPEGAH